MVTFTACIAHDLRYSVAGLLIQQEANPKYIQQQLGCGSISNTLDVYSHRFQVDHRHHVCRLDDSQARPATNVSPESESAIQTQPAVAGGKESLEEQVGFSGETTTGGVTERSNVPVLKTGDGVTHSRVQISPPPPSFNGLCGSDLAPLNRSRTSVRLAPKGSRLPRRAAQDLVCQHNSLFIYGVHFRYGTHAQRGGGGVPLGMVLLRC